MRALVLPVFLLFVASCGSCGEHDAAQAPPPPAAEAPIAAPPGVLAEIALAAPDANWKRAQAMVGGVAALAPATFGGVMAMALGADASLGEQIDGAATARAMVVGDAASARLVWAVHLKSGAKARKALVDGDAAKWSASGEVASIDVVVGAGTPGKGEWVLGLTHGEFLVAAKSRGDLEAFGPYAYRTLPTLAPPAQAASVTVSHAALAGPVAAWLEAQVATSKASLLSMDEALRTSHGGRSPDFGEPRVIVGALGQWASSLVAVTGDLDHVAASLDLAPGGVALDVRMTPAPVAGPSRAYFASLRPGDASALLDAADGAVVTAMLRSDATARSQNAADLADTIIQMSDGRLAPGDAKSLTAGLGAFAKERGDFVVAAVGAAAPRGLLVTTRVASDVAGCRALGQVVDACTRPPLYGLIEGALDAQSLKSASVDFDGVGKGRLVTVKRSASPRSLLGPEIGLGFAAKDGLLAVAIGPDPAALMKSAAHAEHTFGADAKVAEAVHALAADASFAAVIVPGALSAAPRSDAVVVGAGRRGDEAFFSASASAGAVRQLASMLIRGL